MQLIRFAKKMVIFLIPLTLLLLIVYFALFRAGYYPVMTNSPSLDAKLLDYRAHNFKNIDVLSIGSSINLNALDSSEIKLPDSSLTYYNFGAWGLQISDTLYLLKYLTNTNKPKCVIVVSSNPDFTQKSNVIFPKESELQLINSYLPYFYYKSSLLAVVYRNHLYKQYRTTKDDYSYLGFDQFGGVPLNIPTGKISKKRWNEKLDFPTVYTEYQYKHLQELAMYLKNKNITFIFAQSPLKKALVASADSNRVIQNHFNKCKTIIDENGGHYINLHNPSVFDDSLFVDQYHLSGVGSKNFTKLLSVNIRDILN